ncbi:MAG: copper resistance system multicopper oxidase [Pseudomonadales bacterium]|nr:copper resistance system multicopper oxidase [Pseudomonadales bacterium]NRA17037.1 copper resistance system multicopper oxidase [Oceanospirillaceae bacterium]
MSEVNFKRRQFVTGLTLGGVIAGFGLSSGRLFGAPKMNRQPELLRGNSFNLSIGEQAVNFTGRPRIATTVNNSLPAPILRFKQGERININVANNLSTSSSIHWHGLILPSNMDGVPGISFDGIKAKQNFQYQFDAVQSGTYWYHSHSGFQEQTGVYGAIIIDPIEPEPFSYDRDYVVMLSDWSDENPHDIYAKLKKLSHYYNFNERTASNLWSEIKEKGVKKTWGAREMWNQMRMSDTDISDVTGYSYTFLMNGETPSQGWKGLFKRGEKIRLRFINGSAMTFFDIRIPGLKMTVVAADGQYVQPVSVDEFRIGVAETYDVIVEPSTDSAYSVFAQAIDRSGYARGTLTPDLGLQAQVPEMDPVPVLTHQDMGMSMAGMNMAGMSGMDHSKMNMGGMSGSAAMDHSKMNMGGMKMAGMAGMDHSKMNMGAMSGNAAMDHSKMNMGGTNMAGMSGMDHSKMNMTANPALAHADTEYGAHVDARASDPQYRLDDPGVGLRNNGRRVLTYADLRNLNKTVDKREPEREIDLHLTGNMSRYMWSINGVKYSEAEPIKLNYGERVRINFVNDTMMNHPMHLHGMWSELETGDKDYLPRKHTIVVQPGAKISYQLTADAMGKWAYHCHLLYHMPAMFREVHVS